MDFSMIGAFGSSNLSGDLITKLKETDKKALVQPIEQKIENLKTSKEDFLKLKGATTDLFGQLGLFSNTNNKNVFDQFTADASGNSVIFDSTDTSKLNEGRIEVDISELAKRNVFQSGNTFNSIDALAGDTLISINGGANIDTTGKSIKEVAELINTTNEAIANVEEVNDGVYRLIVKAQNMGTAGSINITDSNSLFNITEVQPASDMTALVDGLNYTSSDNNIDYEGLNITAVEKGLSTINLRRDDNLAIEGMKKFVSSYNSFITEFDNKIYSKDTESLMSSDLKNIKNSTKDSLFLEVNGDYLFNYGISLESNGQLKLDETLFANKIKEDKEGVKKFFTGTESNPGLFTQFNKKLDDMFKPDGLISNYESRVSDMIINFESEKDKQLKAINTRYNTMAESFIGYGSTISKMQNGFSGLQMSINQSISSK